MLADKKNKQLVVVVGLIEQDGKILVTRRVSPGNPDWDKKWEFPGGKIQAGETPEEALVREIEEETGLAIYDIKQLGIYTHFWNCPDHIQQTFLICYSCQTNEKTVRLSPSESDAFLWVSPDEFMQLEELLSGTQEIYETLAPCMV